MELDDLGRPPFSRFSTVRGNHCFQTLFECVLPEVQFLSIEIEAEFCEECQIRIHAIAVIYENSRKSHWESERREYGEFICVAR